MSYTYESAHAKAGGLNSATTSGVDTTTCDLLIVVGSWDPGSAPTITDSQSNTWTRVGTDTGFTFPYVGLWFCRNPSVSASHTFTLTKTAAGIGMAIAGFAGSAAAPQDQNSEDGGASTTSRAPGSVTPTQNNELIVTALSYSIGSSSDQAASGFTTTDHQAFSAGNNYGCVLAYAIQTTATATNPNWTWTGATDSEATVVTFKAAAATATKLLALLGVG
jgi:hypothetical protein